MKGSEHAQQGSELRWPWFVLAPRPAAASPGQSCRCSSSRAARAPHGRRPGRRPAAPPAQPRSCSSRKTAAKTVTVRHGGGGGHKVVVSVKNRPEVE